MNYKIKVSIIVAFYKSEPFIRKCIDSIISQTYNNIEIILVDDGSPDKCGEICDEYAKKDRRIIVIHEENLGVCEARNNGLERASGKYVSIIDGDDWLSPDYVEYLLDIIIKTNSEMAMTDHIFTTRDQLQVSQDEITVISPEEALGRIIYPIIPIGPWNKLYSLDLIKRKELLFDVKWSGEGLYFSAMVAQYSNHVGIGHRKIYNYRLNNNESGLTKYNVVMGINALENIKYIRSKSIYNTQYIKGAFNWHIWKNYNFLLKLIIATNSKEKYYSEYNNCLKYIKHNFIMTVLFSEVQLKEKMRMFYQWVFPTQYAKKTINKELKLLIKDKMN